MDRLHHLSTLPDLSDADLDELIARLTEEEKQISYDRSILQGTLDLLVAERAARMKGSSLVPIRVEQLAHILSRKATPGGPNRMIRGRRRCSSERGDMRCYRHGDVILVATEIPADAVAKPETRIVLAEGEVTGHAHLIHGTAEAYEQHTPDTQRAFLRVLAEAGVELRHEEHATLVIPPGDYEVLRQREYAPDAERRVTD